MLLHSDQDFLNASLEGSEFSYSEQLDNNERVHCKKTKTHFITERKEKKTCDEIESLVVFCVGNQ